MDQGKLTKLHQFPPPLARTAEIVLEELPYIEALLAEGATFAMIAVALYKAKITRKPLSAETLRDHVREARRAAGGQPVARPVRRQTPVQTRRATPNEAAPPPAAYVPPALEEVPSAVEVPAASIEKPRAKLGPLMGKIGSSAPVEPPAPPEKPKSKLGKLMGDIGTAPKQEDAGRYVDLDAIGLPSAPRQKLVFTERRRQPVEAIPEPPAADPVEVAAEDIPRAPEDEFELPPGHPPEDDYPEPGQTVDLSEFDFDEQPTLPDLEEAAT